MLIIERTVHDAIRIGADIEIKVIAIPGRNRVRLGLSAPKSLAILPGDGPNPAGQTVPPEQQLKVLMIEDNDDFSVLIKRALDRIAWVKHDRAGTGEEGMAMLQSMTALPGRAPDLILLDIGLPDISGLDLLRKIKTMPATQKIPVTVLSGSHSEEDVESCLAAGANAYLTKASDYEHLCRQMYRVMNFWHHAEQAVAESRN